MVFALGGFLAGLGVLLVLREGVNETWFTLAASAPAGALSAVGVGVGLAWLSKQGVRRPLLLAAALTIPVALMVLVLTWNWPIDPESPAPRVLPWLAAVLPWLIAPMLAWLALRWAARDRAHMVGWQPVGVLAVGIVVLTSIATRPAAAWTAIRPVNTQIGVVQPNAGGGGSADSTSVDSLEADRSAGAAWLLENASIDSVVSTTSTVSGFLPAVTGLRTYLSGRLYQAGLGVTGSRAEVERRASVMESLASDDWEPALVELCDAGVDYFWIEGETPIITSVDASFTSQQVSILSSADVCP